MRPLTEPGSALAVLRLRTVSVLLPTRPSGLQRQTPSTETNGLLRDVSFELLRGQCLALLCERDRDGSLLLDLISGHVRVSSGTIELDGRSVGDLPPRARRIGMVSLRDPLFPHLSLRDNVAFPLHAQRIGARDRARRVGDALALMGLESVAALRPQALDAAARVRTAIARALVFDPSLILLDDPFRHLDPGPRQSVQRLIRRLVRARGLTILMTTGDRDEALLLGDEIGVLEDGRLRQVGTALELLDRPADAAVARRIGDSNLLTGLVLEIDDQTARVRLSSGTDMEAELGEPLEQGALCVLCVRPDRIATAFLDRQSLDPATDSLQATLVEAIHFGDHVRLRFRLADGTELLVRRPPAAVTGSLKPDRRALLAWQPHQARLFGAPAQPEAWSSGG